MATTSSGIKDENPDPVKAVPEDSETAATDRTAFTFLELHWLRIHERIVYKLSVQTYRALNGSAPRYLSSQLTRVADMSSRLRLRSAASASSMQRLAVLAFRLTTVGRRSFSVASANIWNALPDDVTSAPSLQTFRQRLKSHLFGLPLKLLFSHFLYSGSGPCSDTVT